jgi:hypothetical protein
MLIQKNPAPHDVNPQLLTRSFNSRINKDRQPFQFVVLIIDAALHSFCEYLQRLLYLDYSTFLNISLGSLPQVDGFADPFHY